MRITNSGFAFLLQDINSQIWTLLLQYLEHSTAFNMDPVDVLHFLFMLGSLELGQDYSTSMLTDTQYVMLQDLRDYGIVFQRKVLRSCHSLTLGKISAILSNSSGNFTHIGSHCSLIKFKPFTNLRPLRFYVAGLHYPRNKLSSLRLHKFPSPNRHLKPFRYIENSL